MTEVFKSEAVHTLSSLVWTVFVAGAMSIVSILCGVISYNSPEHSYIPSILAAVVAAYFFARARKDYITLNRYIHFPPNCKIVDTHSLTSDE